jgi:TRAP-type C4-dicarboxylate transport system permease small subunit
MERFQTFVRRLCGVMTFIAGVFLTAMILLTCANILFRLFWVPISGTFELMGFFGAVAVAFALGYTQLHRGHIAVDVLITLFSEKTKTRLRMFNDCICFVFFVLVAWRIADKAGVLRETGEVTETLRIIYYPFTYATAAGCAALALVFLAALMAQFAPGREPKS